MSKKILSLVIVLVLIMSFILAACGDKEEAPTESKGSAKTTEADNYGYYGKLHVDGTVLKSEDGKTVQLRGMSTHGLSWFPQYVNKENMEQTQKEWGSNVFRLAMYTDESDGYAVSGEDKQDELKDLIEQAVKDAEDLGMYIIIDWHILKDNNPHQHMDQAIEFFEEMSDEFADNENVIYEICNEPNGDTTWADIKSYAEKVIPVIRKNDSDAVIIVGTPTWSQDVDKAAEDPITDYDNIMYAFHFYAATHKADFRDRVQAAVDVGLPIFVSEFGICDASGNGAIDQDEANSWLDFMNKNSISYCMWNFSNKDESSAIIKSSVTKVSGLTKEDLSEAGLWFINSSPTSETSNSKDKSADSKTADTQKDNDSKKSTKGLTATVTPRDSWNDGSNDFSKFEMSIDNSSSSNISSWTATITFSKDIAISESWNGKFKAKGKTLTITPESYNGSINSGGKVEGIGFILKADKDIKVKSVVVK